MRKTFSNVVERARVVEGAYATALGTTYGAFRFVRKGVQLIVFVGDGLDWDHVSVSTPKRCPTWEEMCWIKDLFWEVDEEVIQFHPAAEDYVNDHPFCLHLWRPQREYLPTPPAIAVGLGRKSVANVR